jgi:hypothetical protein
MAWLSLAIVILIFFIPGINVCLGIASQNINLNIPILKWGLTIPVPFTGPIKLFVISGGVWLAIWFIFYVLTFYYDRFRLPLLKFFSTLINSKNPLFSIKLPVFLAKFMLWLVGIKSVLYVLSSLLSSLLKNYLITLTITQNEFILSMINGILNSPKWLKQFDTQWLISAFVLSVLILIVNRVSRWEKRKITRHAILLKQMQSRKQQKEISIPAGQI